MIDWQQTTIQFGYGEEILSTYRPLVVFVCDRCGKCKPLKVRNKSKRSWLCPSCVKLKSSVEISQKMKSLWNNHEYRQSQLDKKTDYNYIKAQSLASIKRWEDPNYRKAIEKGIDTNKYIRSSEMAHGETFDYTKSNFKGWHDKIHIKCKYCGNILYKDPQKHLQHGFCQYCNVSSGQRDISKYLDTLGVEYSSNERNIIPNQELDIYSPKYNIAIEYNGLYWHSYNALETSNQRLKHQSKSLNCAAKGIKLYQIYDYEWKKKQKIVKSIISNALSRSQRVDARKLAIREIDDKTSSSFFEHNHLYGHRPAKYTIALLMDDTILAAMSFNKHKEGYEIIRFAYRCNYTIRGGASRLLAFFRRSHTGTIYTYADLRFSTGNVYNVLGFSKIKTTEPGYFYYRQHGSNYSILSRQQCQKHKLKKKLLKSYDQTLSESQNMFNNYYRRVWNAGNFLYILK
jgi:hypothetical protein